MHSLSFVPNIAEEMEAIYSALDVDSYHCFLKYVRNIFLTSTGLPLVFISIPFHFTASTHPSKNKIDQKLNM